jgi:hypothetical protein
LPSSPPQPASDASSTTVPADDTQNPTLLDKRYSSTNRFRLWSGAA